ncbi:MAG: phosphotriesterase family protein [Candidatus Binatia bacterium]
MNDLVQTVLGPKKISELGKMLVHEHLVIGWPGWEGDSAFPFNRKEAIKICCDQLDKLKALGVKTFVDPCPNDLGRDVEFMAECAQKTGMNVVCSTGFYKEDLGGSVFRFRAGFGDVGSEVLELYLKEIEEGIGSTGIKAGLIKCATGEGSIKPYEEMLLRSAARAQKKTGVPIITHTDHGSLGDKQLEIFFSEGVKPDRIAIGHSDDRADLAYHAGILDRGAFLSFDRMGLELIFANKLRIASLIALLASGYEKQMLISHDSVQCWRGRPLPSHLLPVLTDYEPTFIFRVVLPKLREVGFGDKTIETVLVDNPRRFFAGG